MIIFATKKENKSMKHNFLKMSLAAALTLTGIAAVSTPKTVAATKVKNPIKRVQINYLAGKGVKIWTNYENGQLVNFEAKNKSKWNVADIATDKKGNLWYKVGVNEWIEARYTTELPQTTTSNKKPQKSPSNEVSNTTLTANSTVTSSNSDSQTAVVKLAKSQVGKAYTWGGNGPDSFDCSGLVQYVYSEAAGLNLPRVTTDQVKVGTNVSMDQLQPGDLLFWGSTDAPYHVGIYIGDNQYVNAADPDQGVITQTISSYFYPSVAKRVLD